MSDIWDDPDVQVAAGEYVKWDTPKSIVGTIVALTKGSDVNGNPAVVISIEQADGETCAVTAAQYQLKKKVAELRPGVGDRIAITYEGDEKIDGGKTVKNFTVETAKAEAVAATKPSSLL